MFTMLLNINIINNILCYWIYYRIRLNRNFDDGRIAKHSLRPLKIIISEINLMYQQQLQMQEMSRSST